MPRNDDKEIGFPTEPRLRRLAALPELPGDSSVVVAIRDLRDAVEEIDRLRNEIELMRNGH